MVMSTRTGPFVWLAESPSYVLWFGFISFLIFLVISYLTGEWHWFGRGGAMMALSGFIVSVQEALLYSPPKPAEYGKTGVGLDVLQQGNLVYPFLLLMFLCVRF
jgi:hypothetical protein